MNGGIQMTIHDVAKIAGVSKSTVSRYFNNGYVSATNRQKIAAAIEQTGYKSNLFARSLKNKKSQIIAVLIPRFDSYTVIETLKGINGIFAQYNYQMIIVPKTTIEEDEITYLQQLSKQGFDGIIVMARTITKEHVLLAQTAAMPIVFTGQADQNVFHFTVDDYKVGQFVGTYSNSLAGERLLYIGVSAQDHAVGIERKNGFMSASQKQIAYLETGFRVENTYTTLTQYPNLPAYDIIVGATDNIALGAMQYYSERGVQIPQDVQIVGIGNYNIGSLVTPKLTTISIDYEVLGQNAALKLMELLSDLEEPIIHDITMSLVVRESTR